MFQLAKPKQRHHESAVARRDPAPARAPAFAPGKRTLAEKPHHPTLGEPDFYGQAVDSALRALDAIRSTALPAYVAVRKKQDLSPLKKEIELVRAALVVRQMMLAANTHVAALEHAETYVNPMVRYLRARLDRLVVLASRLGVYDNAQEMKPARNVEPPKRSYDAVLRLSLKPSNSLPPDPNASLVSSLPPRTRVARGTGAPPPPATPPSTRTVAAPVAAPTVAPVATQPLRAARR